MNCKIKLLLAGKSRWPRYLNVKVKGLCEIRAWGCCEGFSVLSASRKVAEGKISVLWASPCFLLLTLTETQQVFTLYREFGSPLLFSYFVAFSWVPGLFCETMKCLVVKAKPLNNSSVARVAEECLKMCSIPLSGWGSCWNSPGTTRLPDYWESYQTNPGTTRLPDLWGSYQTNPGATRLPYLWGGGAAFYWNSFWFIDIFFRFDSFHPFIISEFPMYTCHCPWSSPSDSLNCNCSLHGSSFCTHNSMPLLRFPVCRRQFLIAPGGEMCVKGVDQTARFQGCEPGMFPK